MNFDWRTDEEESWTPQPEPTPRPSRIRRRRLLVGLVAAGALILALAHVYRHAQRRIAATEEAVTGDVLASHELVTMAARTGDAEMLRPVLSGADDDWTAAQLSRVTGSAGAGPELFGFAALEGEEPAPAVELNPEMRAAELTWAAGYVVTNSAGLTATVLLTHTAVYRRGEVSWLLAPPAPEFWDGSDEYRGNYLEAIFPGRDEAIATRLARGLDSVLAEVCSAGCPAGYRLRLIFSPDPASFAELQPAALLATGRSLVLPAPTLVGLPVDGPALVALERGYAALVTTAVYADLAGYDCCQNSLYASAWIHWLQHRRGLRPWPLDTAAYEALLLGLPSTSELTGLLGANLTLLAELTAEQWAPVYSFVQFLHEEYGPAVAFSALHVPADIAVAESGITPETWAGAWPRFVHEKSLSGHLSAPPAPLPQAELAMQCAVSEELVGLRRVDSATGEWQLLYANVPISAVNWPDTVYAEPFGAGKGLLLISRQSNRDASGFRTFDFSLRLVSPADGTTTTVLYNRAPTWEELPSYSVAGADPGGRYLALADYTPQRGGNPPGTRYFLADLQRCGGEGCSIHEISGDVFWSPSGAHTLVKGPAPVTANGASVGQQLFEGDSAAGNVRPVGWASHTAWLDDSHYVYVGASPEEQDLVVRTVGQQTELLRRPLSGLWVFAGAAEAMPGGYALTDHTLRASPTNSRQLLLNAGMGPFGGHGDSLLLLVEFAEGWQEVEAVTPLAVDAANIAFSATGRWLGVASYEGSRNGQYMLLDLHTLDEPGQRGRRAIGASEGLWAPEGDWLALTGDTYLLLYNPTAGYTHFLPVEGKDCYTYAWIAQP